ncbi:S1 family peptidase [Catellatospora sichuanensis]|uniref:S1 family peptidase n=1 Tax=Catellatospora sichuanensis TaxID=1969805 RepID=UPI001642DD5B|nr:S1 family peptidase [Catellatospora sichuanensis]
MAVTSPAHADPLLPSLVDDGAYPGAAAILAAQNVRLLAGDGHIVIADCATPPSGDFGLLKVYTTDETIGADGIGRVCFKVNAAAGWLNLEVPGVYEIRGDGQRTGTGHAVTAELTTETGDEITVAVDPDGSTQVGLGADPDNPPTILLQLRTGAGPAPVTGTNAAVGKLATGQHSCTATLIAPQWVLTAASCFADNPDQPIVAAGAPATPTQITFPGHASVAVDHLAPRADRDLVLARLATPISGIAASLPASTPPAVGATLQTVGYGRTDTQWVADTQHTAVTALSAVTGTTLQAATSSGLVCKGNAGGPASNANGKIAAVLSRAGQGGCLDVSSGGTDVVLARVDDLAGWIRWHTTLAGVGAGENWSILSGASASQHVAGQPGVPGTDPYEGSTYTSVSAAQENASIYQDISLTVNPGDTFCANAHVVTEGTAAGGGGSFALHLMGGAAESSAKSVVNLAGGNNWTPLSTCVTAASGHTAVRVQFWPMVGGPAIGIDAVDVHKSIAVNGGFNKGSSNWTVFPDSNFAAYGSGVVGNNPYEGTGFAATNTAVNGGGGIYQDVNLAINPGDTYCGSAQVATQGATGGASGNFVIWLIGASHQNSLFALENLPGGDNWTPVTTCVTATTTYNKLRVQFYPHANTGTVIIDAVDVHKSIAVNGGFNNGFSNWTVGANSYYATYGPGVTGNDPYEGTGFAATSTNVTSDGIFQDVNLAINPGDTYCGSAQVATQGTTGGASGNFVIWLIGASEQNAVFALENLPGGDNWTPVTTCITATTTYNRLRVQFYPHPNTGSVIIDAVDVHKSLAVNGGFNVL